ncbi:TPA: hypothetical protein ACRNDO_002540 [Pseudomonas aeruginosa]
MNLEDKLPIYANLAVIDMVVKGARLDGNDDYDERLLETAKSVEMLRDLYCELFHAVAHSQTNEGLNHLYDVMNRHMESASFIRG